MKIIHTGDIHLGDLTGPTRDGRNLRREDTLRCMQELYHRAFLEEPEVTIIAGDLFNRSRVWADTALDDVNDALEKFIVPLCKCSDAVVLLFGTMNHDNPRAFELIKRTTKDHQNLHIFTEPKVEEIVTSGGPVQIVAVPGFDKARLRLFCPGADKETENRNATALINDIALGLSTELDKSKPSILVAHYTVSGSEADNGSTFLAGQDVVILPATIDAMGVNLACFGHIHKPQQLVCQTPAFYCGSVNQLTFNDEGTEHGFYIHTIDDQVSSEFVGTSERKHYTLRMSQDDVVAFITSGAVPTSEGIVDAVVRVRYPCTAEQDKTFNRAELQKRLMETGAFYVAEVMPEDVEELDAKDQLTEHDGPVECLARWLEINGVEPQKTARLAELAAPIIKQADDGRGDSKHTGTFSPRSIEVKNYRSYTAASFDFEPVHMAMVNGSNGVGKSSLFMDALADCLYEQTRKEDVGGWVRDGTKSGSITFTFGLGDQDYRVIRTRTRSGRGTLALQRWDADGHTWVDESDTTMKLTQTRIEQLLGMDCTTFCSIALIRQDAYGLFLEAGSDQRMVVLSALLDLDIYGRMEDLAKAGATEQRRKLAAIRERSAILDEIIQQKDTVQNEDAELSEEAADVEKIVKDMEADLREVEAAETLRKEIIRKAEEKKKEAQDYRLQAADKVSEYLDLEAKHSEAEAAADGLEDAVKAAERVKAARELMQRLAPDVEKDKDLVKERVRAINDLKTSDEKAQRLASEKVRNELVVSAKDEIIRAKDELAEIVAKKDEVRQRLADMEKTTTAYQQTKAACNRYLQEARADVRAREVEIKRAKDEAARLEYSGCPVPENAICKFLVAAVGCKQMLPGMLEDLEIIKEKHRKHYDELKAAVDETKAAIDEIGDPLGALSDLECKERRLRSITAKEADIAVAEVSLEKIEASVLEVKRVFDEATTRVDEIDAERERLTQVVTAYQKADGDVRSLSALAETRAECQAAAAKVETLGPQIKKLKAEVEELRGKSEQALRDADEITARVPENGNMADRIRANIEVQRRTLTDLATRRGQLRAKLEDIAEAEEKSRELRREAADAGVVLSDYTTLTQAFSLDGIQYMIVRGVVPEIMRRSNEILAAMTGGRMAVDIRTEREQKSTKQIVNSLEVWINTITGGNRPYLSHSGGEKVKIALAVTLGLADVKARRAGVQLGMLFIDEPPFLDADGTEVYADALTAMASRNPNMRILAISHDPTMKARFVQNIVVTGGEDGSTVTME